MKYKEAITNQALTSHAAPRLFSPPPSSCSFSGSAALSSSSTMSASSLGLSTEPQTSQTQSLTEDKCQQCIVNDSI